MEEILRMTWEDVYRRKGFVEIEAQKAKTARRRLVPISSNLTDWLALAGKTNGRLWPWSKAYLFEAIPNAARVADINWKRNALRHSFISYRLALTQNKHQVAEEAGNSPRMIDAHYRELVTPEQAENWFNVQPNARAISSISQQPSLKEIKSPKRKLGREGKLILWADGRLTRRLWKLLGSGRLRRKNLISGYLGRILVDVAASHKLSPEAIWAAFPDASYCRKRRFEEDFRLEQGSFLDEFSFYLIERFEGDRRELWMYSSILITGSLSLTTDPIRAGK